MGKKRKKDPPEFGSLLPEIRRALESGSWMIAIASMNGNQIRLFRKSGGDPGFPVDDYDTVVNLLDQNLREDRERIEAETRPSPVLAKKA